LQHETDEGRNQRHEPTVRRRPQNSTEPGLDDVSAPSGLTDGEWANAVERFGPGTLLRGEVISHHPWGFFIGLGGRVVGLVMVSHVADLDQVTDPVTERDYPPVGTQVCGVVLGPGASHQIHISTLPSDVERGVERAR
jgi:hypothetical protein